MSKYLVIDTETSGLNPNRNQILCLGAAVYDDSKEFKTNPEPIAVFENYIQRDPAFELDPAALKLNGLRVAERNQTVWGKEGVPCMEESAVIQSFMNWIIKQGQIDYLMGFNVQFDIRFIEQACNRQNINFSSLLPYKTIDPFVLAQTMMQAEIISSKLKYTNLKALCKHYGIIQDDPEFHTVSYDIHHTYLLYMDMYNQLGGR